MAEAHQNFLDFDWSDERWQTYLQGLYPAPNQRQILKFQKKWYKREIDKDFDDTYDPSASAPNSSGASGSTATTRKPSPAQFASRIDNNASRWEIMGIRASICFMVYSTALTLAVGAFAGAFQAYQALIVLVSAFILEVVAKYGVKFNSQYLQAMVLDDVGMMPIMAITLLPPGMHQVLRLFALVPFFLTALLSYAQICKAHRRVPSRVREFFSPLAEISARYRIMQTRADIEVALGFALILGVLTGRAAPVPTMLYWNLMMLRYIVSCWTQASFRKIDGALNPVLGRIPGVSYLYSLLKRQLYTFVDPESSSAGRLCSVL